MQKVFSKTQGIWTLSWGISIILLAIGALIGLDIVRLAPNITGINYIDILYLSGLLFAVGLGFGLSSTNSNERQYLHRISIIWVLMILLGIIMDLLSMVVIFTQKSLVIGNITVDYNNWQPWLYISVGLGLYGLILFFGSMEDPTREKFWKIWPIYLLLIIIGFICGIFSIIAMYSLTGYHSFLSITSVNWIVYGSLPMMLGLVPFAYCISSQESFKGKLDHLWFVWLVVALIGVIIYIIASADILFNLANILKLPSQSNDFSTLLDINGLGKEPELLVGLPFALIGLTFLLATLGKSGTDHLRTLSPIWVLFVLIGIIIVPLNSLAPDVFKNPTMALGLAIIFFGAAMAYKTFSLDYIPELERRPLKQTAVTTGEFEKALGITGEENVPEHATPEEKTLFLTIRKKSIENAQVQFSTAFKLGRCSEAFYLAITDKYRNEIENIDSQITNVRDTAKRSTRKSIFEEEIRRTEPIPATSRGVTVKGESTTLETSSSSRTAGTPASTRAATTVPSPPGPPGVPPAPPSMTSASGPTAPPRPPPSGSPPPPPGMTAPRPATAGPPSPPPLPTATGGPPPPPGFSAPRPSGTPPPPPLPTGGMPPPPPGIGSTSRPMGPPTPTGPPPPPTGGMPLGAVPPAAPGTDVVGTARSTSIAELRGEMLKELRRLRDIFKEEGGPKP